MQPSPEQENIIQLLENKNITIDSCAGSGKTSTVIFITEKYHDSKILVLTYNSFLKIETRKRTKHLKNLEVHSYHSFCTNNYDRKGHVDNVINSVTEHNTNPFNDFSFNIIIVDETQDMNLLYYRFVCKILNDNKEKTNVKIVVMGDKMQSIYKFRDTDSRFITYSQKLFCKYSIYEWVDMSLSKTFRCTSPMVKFLNDCVLGYNRMKSFKESSHKPEYIITNSYGTKVRKVLENYLKIYKPSDIFVIAYSLKDSTPIKTLANWVTNNTSTPIYISGSDQESLDSNVIEGKLVFTTIHSSKGLERKVVIFFGFDDSYFKYYDKVSDPDICPNELYVALTRASERLTVIHDSKNGMLPFINSKNLKSLTDFTDDSPKKKTNPSVGNSFKELSFTVSELISFIPFNIENECMEYINVKTIQPPENKLNISGVVKIGDLYESVSDITGISIPAYYEYTVKGSATILKKNIIENRINIIEHNDWSEDSKLVLITKLKKFSKTIQEFYDKNIKCIDTSRDMTIDELLKVSLYYSAQQNKIEYKLKQITKFDWLSKDVLDEGIKRLKKIVGTSSSLVFEESVERYHKKILIFGEIDCVDIINKIAYELKCTGSLTPCHIIQLIIYSYLIKNGHLYKYKLFNILTNELLELSVDKENLEKIVEILIMHKINIQDRKTDDEFLESVS